MPHFLSCGQTIYPWWWTSQTKDMQTVQFCVGVESQTENTIIIHTKQEIK